MYDYLVTGLIHTSFKKTSKTDRGIWANFCQLGVKECEKNCLNGYAST